LRTRRRLTARESPARGSKISCKSKSIYNFASGVPPLTVHDSTSTSASHDSEIALSAIHNSPIESANHDSSFTPSAATPLALTRRLASHARIAARRDQTPRHARADRTKELYEKTFAFRRKPEGVEKARARDQRRFASNAGKPIAQASSFASDSRRRQR